MHCNPLFHEDCGLVARSGSIFITHITGAFDEDMMGRFLSACDKAVTEGDVKVGWMNIVNPNVPLPSGESKKTMKDRMAVWAPHIAAAATVFLGDGLRIAAIRSFSATMLLLLRRSLNAKIASTVDEAADFLASYAELDVQKGAIVSLVNNVRVM